MCTRSCVFADINSKHSEPSNFNTTYNSALSFKEISLKNDRQPTIFAVYFSNVTAGYTAKNQKLLKTGCNNVVGATLFNVVNNIVRHCYTWLRANSGSTILFNIVDNQEQCYPNNIVASCFQQPVTTLPCTSYDVLKF